jgi:predicted RNA binding protein YcfA (HicA-like mRNA interferase family)
MGKREKLLEKWRNNTPKDEPKEKVFGVLEHYGFEKVGGAGSHTVWYHPALENASHPDINQFGEISVPIKGGQRVKQFYLKTVIVAIDIIENNGDYHG